MLGKVKTPLDTDIEEPIPPPPSALACAKLDVIGSAFPVKLEVNLHWSAIVIPSLTKE